MNDSSKDFFKVLKGMWIPLLIFWILAFTTIFCVIKALPGLIHEVAHTIKTA